MENHVTTNSGNLSAATTGDRSTEQGAAGQFVFIHHMRRRLGLDADDASKDAAIISMTPTQRLGLIAGWKLGYSGWEHTILSWVKDVGFKISEPHTPLPGSPVAKSPNTQEVVVP